MSSVSIVVLCVLFFGVGMGIGFVMAALMRPEERLPKVTPARRWKDYEAARRDDTDIEHQTGGAPGRPRDYASRYDGMGDRDIMN